MLNRRCIVFFVSIMTAVGSFGAGTASGEGCANAASCQECIWNGWVGHQGVSGWGSVSTMCFTAGETCTTCYEPLARDDSPDAALIIAGIRAASRTDLKLLAQEYSDRLFLYTPRNMLAVASKCNAAAVDAVVFLPPEVVQELSQLGLRQLNDVLSEE